MSNVSDREHASAALVTVQSFYAALARCDVPGVIALLAPDIEWTEAEGFPYYSGTWRSPQSVLDNLFARIGQDWDGFSAITLSYVTENDRVVAFGDYGGIHRTSERPLRAPYAHCFRVRDNRIASFIQHTDTVLVARALP
ncbi:MAG: nuclear transport factor 2 family protein [Hyphomicrobium sp.]